LIFPYIAQTEKYTTRRYLLVKITLSEEIVWWMGGFTSKFGGEEQYPFTVGTGSPFSPSKAVYIHLRYQIFE
jgi:hypothetical protein